MSVASSRVTLIDFGMGNLRNVARALERAGAEPRVTCDPDQVRRADRVILPGVGSLGDCMGALRQLGIDAALRERIRAGRPYLGLCLGLQVLFEKGEEGEVLGLAVIPGTVARFDSADGLRVPHMGWNSIRLERPHRVIREGYFYFVHSYRPVDVPAPAVIATTEYGASFPSAVAAQAAVAVQFHPEKSQAAGLALLQRFCEWSP